MSISPTSLAFGDNLQRAFTFIQVLPFVCLCSIQAMKLRVLAFVGRTPAGEHAPALFSHWEVVFPQTPEDNSGAPVLPFSHKAQRESTFLVSSPELE
jgi:hypothetical protein